MKNPLSLTALKLQPVASITSNDIKYIIYIFLFNQVPVVISWDFLFQEYVQNSIKDPREEFQDHFTPSLYKLFST